MRLADFIRANTEKIASEWERFAATLLPQEDFSRSILRNGIVGILATIADDMDETQNRHEQKEKSQGLKPALPEDSFAETHALQRARMGLSSMQLISEFRALRASVIQLWVQNDLRADKKDFNDLTRFNEAVDQALAETATRFSEHVEQSRDLFLGVLGHDLKNPLNAIMGAGDLLLRGINVDKIPLIAEQIVNSSTRMSIMITNLLQLTRVRLDKGITTNPVKTDIGNICSAAIKEMKTAFPKRDFRMETKGDLMGEWDISLMGQVLSNLLGNAVQHGAVTSPIIVTANGENEDVILEVHNEGAPIASDKMENIFNCFFQGDPAKTTEGNSSSVGLGLYISKEIVRAHGGNLKVRSLSEQGTTFIANLPRSLFQNQLPAG